MEATYAAPVLKVWHFCVPVLYAFVRMPDAGTFAVAGVTACERQGSVNVLADPGGALWPISQRGCRKFECFKDAPMPGANQPPHTASSGRNFRIRSRRTSDIRANRLEARF